MRSTPSSERTECLLVAVLQLGKTWLAIVCAFTVYPAIVGWLFFNGFGILIKALSRLRGREVAIDRSAWLVIALLLLIGVTFAALSVWLLIVLLHGFAAWPAKCSRPCRRVNCSSAESQCGAGGCLGV